MKTYLKIKKDDVQRVAIFAWMETLGTLPVQNAHPKSVEIIPKVKLHSLIESRGIDNGVASLIDVDWISHPSLYMAVQEHKLQMSDQTVHIIIHDIRHIDRKGVILIREPGYHVTDVPESIEMWFDGHPDDYAKLKTTFDITDNKIEIEKEINDVK